MAVATSHAQISSVLRSSDMIFTRAGSDKALNIIASDSAARSATAAVAGGLHTDCTVIVEAACGAGALADVVFMGPQPIGDRGAAWASLEGILRQPSKL